MKNPNPLGMCTACVAVIVLGSGAAFAQETRSQTPEHRPQAQQQWPQQREPAQQQEQRQSQAPGVDDESPLHDDPDVKKGDEEGIVPDGQHADHLHWSNGTMPQNGTLIGADVLNRDNEVVGRVVDIILDEDEAILEVIVETGERMGLAGKKVAIPKQVLQPVHTDEEEFHLVIDTDLESLMNAPEYKRD